MRTTKQWILAITLTLSSAAASTALAQETPAPTSALQPQLTQSAQPPVGPWAPQPGPAARNVLHFDPVAVAFGVMNIGFERAILNHATVAVDLLYAGPSTWGNFRRHTFGFNIQPNLYARQAGSGPYLAPFWRYGAAGGPGDTSYVGQAFGADLGWAWLWNPLQIKAGVGVVVTDVDRHRAFAGEDHIVASELAVGPDASVTIGIAF
jgi:hypothetical protein